MKHLLLLFVLSIVRAQAECPLVRATEGLPLAHERAFVFVKDERVARAIMAQFDGRQLRFAGPANDGTCSPGLRAQRYLRGLIHGMRHYYWSPETIALGLGNVKDFVRAVRRARSSLGDLIIAADVLRLAAEARLLTVDVSQLSLLLRDLLQDQDSLTRARTDRRELEQTIVRLNINRLDPYLL